MLSYFVAAIFDFGLQILGKAMFLQAYDRGEPAISYKWTGWVWEITGWSSKLQENYWSL